MFRLPTIDLEKNPTASRNYVDRPFAKGTPLYWRDDITGRLPAAVMAYLDGSATDAQLKLVIAYIQYHIHAPCWLESNPTITGVDDEMAIEIRALRVLSLTLQTLEDVNRYIHRALEIALDPL